MKQLVFLAAALGATGGVVAETRVSGADLVAEARVSGADLVEIRAAIHRQIDAYQACARRSGGPGASTTPAVVSFLELTVMGAEDVVQQVQVTDRAGAVWHAYYAMQRQKDGRWRASGCHLVPSARTVSAAYQPQ